MPLMQNVLPTRELHREVNFALNTAYALPANTAGWWFPLSYTMPFDGSMACTTYVAMAYSGASNHIAGSLANSTPSPANGFDFALNGDGRDGLATYQTGKILFHWPSVAAGTPITIRVDIQTDTHPGGVDVHWLTGTLRMVAFA